MKNYLSHIKGCGFVAVLLMVFPFTGQATAASPIFKARQQTNLVRSLYTQFTHSDTIPLQDMGSIYALSIDAAITQPHEASFVRVVLEDTEGHDYLVAESDRFRNDSTMVQLLEYCEETALLQGITPVRLKCYLAGDATLTITGIHTSKLEPTRGEANSIETSEIIKETQAQDIVDRINKYNIRHGKLWIAGVTEMSLMDFEAKKRVLGMQDDSYTGGLEYYVGGVFEVGDLKVSRNSGNSSPFVPEFDWRDRHGKNWITPVKDQGESGFCSAFTTCSTVEATLNLYLNNLVNLDLSEQEAACCNGTLNVYNDGMSISAPLAYCKNHGICDDAAYPFVDDSLESTFCRSGEIDPYDIVQISQYMGVSSSTDSILKRALIEYGPLASGFKTSPYPNHKGISHAMSLIGFKEVHLGDTIQYVRYPSGQTQYTGLDPNYIVGEHERDSLIIGKTIWIFKNSYVRSPYWYMVFDKQANIHYSYAINPQISWFRKDNNGVYTDMVNIICEDADGDGYYFWGLGEKPTSCPSWAPTEPDGDDHSYRYGPMDEFGNLRDLSLETANEIIIDDDVLYDTRRYVYNSIRIVNGGKLTIKDMINLYGNCIIYVENGGQLIIDGGTLQDACLQLGYGSSLTIRNKGIIKMRSNCNFESPQGAVVNIEYGSIQ